jgi:hypothetical protein
MQPYRMHMRNGNGIFYQAMHPSGMRNTPKRTAARNTVVPSEVEGTA